MGVLFCKSTEMRKPEFQIYTSIVDEMGEIYAVKRNVYHCGGEHIREIADNYEMLRQVYGEYVVGCKVINGAVYFPFINGETLGESLRDMIRTGKSEDIIRQALMDWRKLIQGRDDNLEVFSETEKFKIIFGGAEELIGDKALHIANFDCIADNVIISESGIKMIDYEWVFDFAVPEELVYYRVLQVFFGNNKDIISFHQLLSLADVDTGKISIYDRLLQKFESWISFDNLNDIDYISLGKRFTKPKIQAQNIDTGIEYEFPFEKTIKGCDVAIYGAGAVGLSYYLYIKKGNICNLITWVDKNYEQYREQGFDVNSIDNLDNIQFDYIIIAIYNDETARIIEKFLLRKGIEKGKILWKKPVFI
jgi:hypothetical protein